MYKKLFLSAFAVLVMAAMPSSIFAKDASSSVYELSAVNSTATYTGTMAVTIGTLNKSITHTTEATANGSNVDLYIAPFQVGTMPGTIKVDAQDVIADGVARTYSDVVTLNIFGSEIIYSAEIAVTVYNANTLVYTINVKSAEYEGAPFIANVSFSGTAN